MKKADKKKVDRLFREGLYNPEDHIIFHDEDWDDMQLLLDAGNKRRWLIHRLPIILGSVAACLFLAIVVFFLKPELSKKGNLVTQVKPNSIKSNQPKSEASRPKLDVNPNAQHNSDALTQPAIALTQNSRHNNMRNKPGNSMHQQEANIAWTNRGNISKEYARLNKGSITKPAKENRMPDQTTALAIADTNIHTAFAPQQVLAAVDVLPQPVDTVAKIAAPVSEKKRASVPITGVKHSVVLSIIAAPDFNGVGSAFNSTKVGTNAGLMLTVGITRKLTLSTGAIYSKKPYMIGFNQYNYISDYKFNVNPASVTADCRVLDIPLNINYQLYNKGLNQFSVGTGLSSYFMLSEKYSYAYTGGTLAGPATYTIKNQNKHLFGVVNINATYQRRINSKFGLNVQPYMKLPITNIGYGRVNLKSTGVAIGASWYLNSSPKIK